MHNLHALRVFYRCDKMNNIKPAKNQTDLLKQDTYTECELKWNCLELFPLNKVESVFKNIVSD